MSERIEDRTIEDEAVDAGDIDDVGVDGDLGIDDSSDFETDFTDFGTDAGQTTATETETAGETGSRLGDAFSVVSFALQLVGAVVGLFVIGGAVPLGPLSGVVGIFVALFALGIVSTEPRYAEAGIAGGLVAVVTTVVTTAMLSMFSGGMVPVAGALAGGAVGLLGHYLGRDLRDGLTRDI